MPQCLTPDYKFLVFKHNPNRPGIYDLQNNSRFGKFHYFRLQSPKSEYLKENNVRYLIESWERGIKILHTGLIPISEIFYYGDHIITTNAKSSLMLFKIDNLDTIHLWYFNNFNKKNRKMKEKFCSDFIEKNGEANIPPLMFNPDNDQS